MQGAVLLAAPGQVARLARRVQNVHVALVVLGDVRREWMDDKDEVKQRNIMTKGGFLVFGHPTGDVYLGSIGGGELGILR